MRWVPLANLVRVRGGGTPRKSNADFYGGTIPWVTPKDMKRSVIADSSVRLSSAGVENSPAKLIERGSVLVVVRSGVLKHTLPVALTSAPVTVNQDMKALTPSRELLAEYLLYFLKARQPQVLSWVRATTADNFPIDKLLELEVPLPSLDEQRRIAGILDQADSLRANRRQALAHLDDLAQSIFLESFGDVAVRGTVDEVAEVQGGLQVSSTRVDLPIEVPYLRVANVHRGRLELGEIKTLQATTAEIERTRLRTGDLLLVEGHGNPLEVGRAAVWDGSIDGIVHQNHLIRVRFNSLSILPTFGAAWLNSHRGREHLVRSGKTTSGLNTISTRNVKSSPVPVPTLTAQRTFEASISGVEAQKRLFAKALRSAGHLFTSLQKRAFSRAL